MSTEKPSERAMRIAKALAREDRRRSRLSARYTRAEAALARTESRLARAFNAWQRARIELRNTVKLLEAPQPAPHAAQIDPELNDKLPEVRA